MCFDDVCVCVCIPEIRATSARTSLSTCLQGCSLSHSQRAFPWQAGSQCRKKCACLKPNVQALKLPHIYANCQYSGTTGAPTATVSTSSNLAWSRWLCTTDQRLKLSIPAIILGRTDCWGNRFGGRAPACKSSKSP